MKKIFEINSTDYWFKVVGMLQQNWALIDKDPDSSKYIVYFVHDASGVFDRMQVGCEEEAVLALKRNGFTRYYDDNEAQKIIVPPEPPFTEAHHPNGPIYSSGRFWR